MPAANFLPSPPLTAPSDSALPSGPANFIGLDPRFCAPLAFTPRRGTKPAKQPIPACRQLKQNERNSLVTKGSGGKPGNYAVKATLEAADRDSPMISLHTPKPKVGTFIVLFCLHLMMGVGLASAAETIRLRADQWMPYNGDPTTESPGYVVELARRVFTKHGITVDYQTMPWTDALKAAAAGEIEGVIGANPSEAKGLLLPAESIGLPRVGLFVPKAKTWTFQSVPLLREIRLGLIEGYSYWESLDDYAHKQSAPKVTWFSGDAPLKDGIAKLDRGEIDVMAETVAVWIWTVKSLGKSPGDYRVAYLHQSEPIYLAFTAQGTRGQRLATLWDTGLAEARRSGELKQILDKYGLVDWK